GTCEVRVDLNYCLAI
ncbi:hypothetical protein ACN38_g6628, partial [Penicillium nordicum]